MHQHDNGGVFAATLDVVEVWTPDARLFGKFGLGQPGLHAVITDGRAQSAEDERSVVGGCLLHDDPFPAALPIGYTAAG
jgi:hypothetical protein